ncbi:hypothetical protein [Streptacidiphilus jiangxiensis]|uniref:Uncharacterized protein n=1 Tax=Streptacidiphilus jiangxiensis TaxID=235985 RepID=A0A1H7ZW40_STRJI|nr:hypothetical protein [Streptacidiphilus jiangxiensis]SEM62665.1 hypothetical protein SAMN05414137_13848 [Streptacidiphilus jiangxiensis]
MSVADRLVRLYPAAFRDRWGESMVEEVRAAGWRGWSDALRGAADLWLHPVLWPVDLTPVDRAPVDAGPAEAGSRESGSTEVRSAGARDRRLGRAATLGLAVALFTALLGHAVGEQGTRLADAPGGPWPARACAALLLLGLALAAPRPKLSAGALRVLAGRAVRRLGVPVLLGAGVVALARVDTGPAGLWEHLAVGCWWLSLAAAAVQACRAVSDVGGAVLVPPSAASLRLGLWSLTAGSLLTGAVALTACLGRPDPDLISVAVGCCLALLAGALAATLHDLRVVCGD